MYLCIYLFIYLFLCCLFVTGFGKICLNAANNFFQYPQVKPYGSLFFEKIFMAEMDRHQLALAYDEVDHTRRLEILAGWTRGERAQPARHLQG